MSKKAIIIILSVLLCICLSLGIVGYVEHNKNKHIIDNNQNKQNTENSANNNVENNDYEKPSDELLNSSKNSNNDNYNDSNSNTELGTNEEDSNYNNPFEQEKINANVIVVNPDGAVASKENKQGWYMLDTSKLKKGKTYNYKLNNQFEIQYSTSKETSDEDPESSYTINNKNVPVVENYGKAETFFYYLKNYLIYGESQTECEPYEIYIVDKNSKAREIYELDKKLDGLRLFGYDVDDTGLTVIGFRWTTEGIISYGDDGVSISDEEETDEEDQYYTKYQKEWAEYGLKEDTIMLGTYKYEYKDGALSETPTIISEVTIKDYLANHNKYDDYVFDFISKADAKIAKYKYTE